LVPDEASIKAITDMGFSRNAGELSCVDVLTPHLLEGCRRCTTTGIRACKATSNGGTDACVNWVMMHMEDADLNDPVTVASSGASKGAAEPPEQVRDFAWRCNRSQLYFDFVAIRTLAVRPASCEHGTAASPLRPRTSVMQQRCRACSGMGMCCCYVLLSAVINILTHSRSFRCRRFHTLLNQSPQNPAMGRKLRMKGQSLVFRKQAKQVCWRLF